MDIKEQDGSKPTKANGEGSDSDDSQKRASQEEWKKKMLKEVDCVGEVF